MTTDAKRGLGWRTLGKVPIRDVVATALRKVVPSPKGDEREQVVPAGPEDADTARQIVQARSDTALESRDSS